MSKINSESYQKQLSLYSSIIKLRPANSHKGDFGHLLCKGGSTGMSGAIALCAKAGLRTGCGLVTIDTEKKLIPLIAPYIPEAMFKPNNIDRKIDAMVIGPGKNNGYPKFHENQFKKTNLKEITNNEDHNFYPILLDAGAVQLLDEKEAGLWKRFYHPLIITPHPGEIAKLTNQPIPRTKKERFSIASKVAQKFNITVVLKGHQTIIVDPSGNYIENLTGNSGLATAGSGDVLAGIIGSLLAQKYDPFKAACLGVGIHGYASDILIQKGSEEALIASDIIEKIPYVFHKLHNLKKI